jgi:WD40 repeat protein
MIQRRQFISSVASLAAIGTIGTICNKSFAAVPGNSGLDWKSTVVETVPHTKHERKPVVTGVSLQNNGSLLAIVGDDHYICLYDVKKQRYIEHLKEHKDWVRAVKFSPDGKTLVTCGNDRRILFWEASDWNQPIRTRKSNEAVINLAFSPDGSKVASVGFDKKVKIFRTEDGSTLDELNCSCNDNDAVAFSSDGQWLAAGGRDGKVTIWEAESLSQIAQFKAHKRRIRSLEFSPDSKLVSAGDDQIVRFTNPANIADYRAMPRQSAKIYATAVTELHQIAIAGSDNLIRLWDSRNSQELGVLEGHTGTVSSLAVSDTLLVSGSFDTTVRLWQRERDETAGHRSPSNNQRQSSNNNGWNRRLN